ncbi:DNA repair protein RecN [bacterium]|nr:DNA repair protein RecN [bacterium]
MLTHLRVSNFALLEEVELDLERGLSFLTGETGAGKSIFIDAICRLLGSRATQDDVRAGESKAVLEAIFDGLPAAAMALLEEWEIDPEEEQFILRREIHSTGRSRMLINNCSVTLQQLRQLAPYLVDLFGQNEHQTLLDGESQRRLYDGCIGIHSRVQELSAITAEIAALQKEWRGLQEREQQRQRNIDILKYQIKEIEEIQPSETEEEELQGKKVLLQNSERIHSLCESLLQVLLEKDDSLVSQLKEVQRSIGELARYQQDLTSFSARVDEYQEDFSELVHRLEAIRRSLDFEESSLDQIEFRLETFHKLKKKYGPTIQQVLEHLERSRKELQADLNVEEREEQLIREIRAAVNRYETIAGEVSQARSAGAREFEALVEKELHQVALEKCRFQVRLEEEIQSGVSEMENRYAPQGKEIVAFEIEPNAGEGFRDLSKIASGGELSRMMLALKVVSQNTGEERALIFDEIDAGIGGRVAYQVGERLKRLSKVAQVLCVTHLPQVAAFGDQHYQVQKVSKGERTITIVRNLDEKKRIEELARMISGSEVTETALRHARELREQVNAGVT